MRSYLDALEVRRRELRAELVKITDDEKHGLRHDRARKRAASKLAHVDAAIFAARQGRLGL